jgi:hypothetical protein
MENSNELKKLDFTDKDISLIMEAVELLTKSKSFTPDFLFKSISDTFSTGLPEEIKLKIDKEMANQKNKMKRDNEEAKEDLALLKAKLVLFKRFLHQNKLMNEVNDILNNPSEQA